MEINIEFFRSLPYADKLLHVASNPAAAYFAYNRLELHRESATLQISRLLEAARRPKPTNTSEDSANFAATTHYVEAMRRWDAAVLIEMHFYFVAWASCYRLLKILTADRVFLPAKRLFDSHRREFEHYVNGRNGFEHFEERLPGQKKESRVKDTIDASSGARRTIYFKLVGQTYQHSDRTWDVSPASSERLATYIDETLAAIHQITDAAIEQKFGPP